MRPIIFAFTISIITAACMATGQADSLAPFGSDLLERPEPTIPLDALRALRRGADDVSKAGNRSSAELALDELDRQDVTEMPRDFRLVVQHAALRVATALAADRDVDQPPSRLEARATEMVRRLAYPAAILERLESGSLESAEAWLGPHAAWTERTTDRCGNSPLHHERAFTGMFAFHPVRSGDRRALISKLVVVDDRGRPHITPIIESIEMRLGMEVDSPVAILELDVDSLETTAALFAPDYDDVHESEFVRKDGAGGFDCTQRCHPATEAWGAADITDPAEAHELRIDRSANLIRYTQRRIKKLDLAGTRQAREWFRSVWRRLVAGIT